MQHNVLANRVSVLAGRYDLNSEFYNLQSAALFLNSSFGIGPEFSQSGVGPSIFPATSAAGWVTYKPTRNLVLRAAMANGTPYARPDGGHALRHSDGVLLVGELGWVDCEQGSECPQGRRQRVGRLAAARPYQHKLALGAWDYTVKFDDLVMSDAAGAPLRRTADVGYYIIGESQLYASAADPDRWLSVFAQIGHSDARVHRFSTYLGMGVVASGVFRDGGGDQLGIGLAVVRNGSPYVAAPRDSGARVNRTETAIDLSYLIQVNRYLAVQPDVQYVINPNTDPDTRDALSLQFRCELSLEQFW